jgi:predicted acetyltransferase
LCFSDAPTARAMIKFLASFNSASSTAKLGVDIAHPFFDHADELWYQVDSSYLWMIRIIDIERAISQRGFSPCLAGDVVVEITDPLFKHNNTRWHISVANGKGTATQTDAPAKASMDIGSFAPIFTGYSTATQMHNSDRLQADSNAIKILDGLFNAPTPVMADVF